MSSAMGGRGFQENRLKILDSPNLEKSTRNGNNYHAALKKKNICGIAGISFRFPGLNLTLIRRKFTTKQINYWRRYPSMEARQRSVRL